MGKNASRSPSPPSSCSRCCCRSGSWRRPTTSPCRAPTWSPDVTPCLGFLQGDDDHPSGECCDGLSGLVAAAATTEDRQAACECLKSAVSGQFTAVEAAPARDLPADCGLSLPYTFSPDVDCSQ
ncbi:hypothetical protein OsJ_21599 [Oryza sativa Japonica Group]|uniref:Non-specific lipid-transfer protein n=1 Tax=Oryza sativa subsp. japonica TaxID=39947 RepID=B9FTM6_ORYSJ|nr:hypothetical protein OsJ_21599 [Oryza sativa Japonica Group]